jgi:hypothetical protein
MAKNYVGKRKIWKPRKRCENSTRNNLWELGNDRGGVLLYLIEILWKQFTAFNEWLIYKYCLDINSVFDFSKRVVNLLLLHLPCKHHENR